MFFPVVLCLKNSGENRKKHLDDSMHISSAQRMLHYSALKSCQGSSRKKWKNPGPPAIIPASDFFLGAKQCIRDVKPPVPPRSSRAKLQQNSSTKMHIRCWRPKKWPPWHFRSDDTLNFYQFPWLSSFSFSFPILTLRSTGILGKIEISLHNFSFTGRH